MQLSTFRDHWYMFKAPQTVQAVTINANREVNFVNFPVSRWSDYDTHMWQSNSEVCTVGIGTTCYVPQVCLCHWHFFPLLPFRASSSFWSCTCLSSILWRLAMCIPRCWHTSSILSHVYTSLPYSRDSLRKTWTRFHHLCRKVHRVHAIYISRFEVTQQGLASLNNCPCLLCVL